MQTFNVFGNDYSNGFTEGFYIGDKYLFEVKENNHTLTLNFRNSTHARVTIQSEPIVALLEKDVLYEFDVDGDGENDIKVRYDGIGEGNKAMLFIQGISSAVEQAKGEDEVTIEEEIIGKRRWLIWFVIVLIIVGVIGFILYNKRRK